MVCQKEGKEIQIHKCKSTVNMKMGCCQKELEGDSNLRVQVKFAANITAKICENRLSKGKERKRKQRRFKLTSSSYVETPFKHRSVS